MRGLYVRTPLKWRVASKMLRIIFWLLVGLGLVSEYFIVHVSLCVLLCLCVHVCYKLVKTTCSMGLDCSRDYSEEGQGAARVAGCQGSACRGCPHPTRSHRVLYGL